MSEIADRYRRLAGEFSRRVEHVPAVRWESPSPCEGWTARDVVRHMVDNCHMFFGLVGREVPSGPSVEEDPVAAWASARDAVQQGVDDPEVAELEYDGQFGRSTFEKAVDRFLGWDLVIHSWDVASATGLDERLDPDLVHEVFEAAKPMGDMLRSSGAFGPEVDPPEGADEQAQLLAFLGRKV